MKLSYEEPIVEITNFEVETVGVSGGIELPDHNW